MSSGPLPGTPGRPRRGHVSVGTDITNTRGEPPQGRTLVLHSVCRQTRRCRRGDRGKIMQRGSRVLRLGSEQDDVIFRPGDARRMIDDRKTKLDGIVW